MSIFEQARERAIERRAQLRQEYFATISAVICAEIKAQSIVEREQAQFVADCERASIAGTIKLCATEREQAQ